jgi:hypothetical protein
MADRQEYIRNAVSFLADPKVFCPSIYSSQNSLNLFSRLKPPLWHSVFNFSKRRVSPDLKSRRL